MPQTLGIIIYCFWHFDSSTNMFVANMDLSSKNHKMMIQMIKD
jgi:hypothetical protein